ncbi:MAG TPA: plasmid replication initiator TrfA, partial [Saprospiraceae bacterium]|nr:plasmid replication initiator TrfA [Saprospiraceae bacterium]
IKSGNVRILELCRKHGIDIDASPWPPTFPKDDEPELSPQPPAKVVQLDFWEDSRRAAPNIVFRSALFPALKFKEGRLFLKQKQLFATKGGEVYFTGEQFDQSDLDVYIEILQFARSFPLGTPVRFTAYSMLKALGRNTGKSDRQWLHAVLTRLRSGTVDMTDHKKRYFGGLIEGGVYDEITTHYEIIINPKFAVLFGFGMWSTLDKAQRRELGRNQTAKALHAYYSTHAAPGPHEYATLAEIAGLTDKNPRKVKMKIIAAHEELKRVGFLSDYKAGATPIKVKINNYTPGQARHLVKKIIKSRKAKNSMG